MEQKVEKVQKVQKVQKVEKIQKYRKYRKYIFVTVFYRSDHFKLFLTALLQFFTVLTVVNRC